MGKRSKRKKLRKKINKRSGRRSDSEMPQDRQSDGSCGGWTSLDEQALLDYGENAAQHTSTLEELEVTRRLGSLNVSMIPCCSDPSLLPVLAPKSDRVSEQGLYSELPCATLLNCLPGERWERRQCRKRVSRRRPSKRPKKCREETEHVMSVGKQRRSGLAQLRYNPLACYRASPSPGPDRSHRVKGGREVWSDASSRAGLLTESSSTPEDADMDHDTTEEASEGCCGMEAQDSNCLSLENESQLCSESEFSSSSDSGCDGDDEESSVEISGSLKVTVWWEQDQLPCSSTDEPCGDGDEEDSEFTEILNGSFPLLTGEGQRMVCSGMGGGEFKHPQLFGIQGSRLGRKKRKKPHLYPCSSLSPHDLNELMVKFVQSSGKEQLELPLVSRTLCHTVSSLAQLHRLQCTLQQQKRRLPVVSHLLKRTPFTRVASKVDVENVLKICSRERQNPWLRRSSSSFSSSSSSATATLSVVGSSSSPLDESNLGRKMLQGMGWKPGSGLGPREEGIREPIAALLRPRFTGLGFSNM